MPAYDSKLETYINGLTEETSPDSINDKMLILDTSGSIMKKISPENVYFINGWISSASMVFSSADAPSYVVTMTGDLSGIYQAGQRIKLTLDNSTRYFIITKVETSGSTALTLYGGTDYVLSASPISNPYYSMVKAPFGFPLDPTKWTTETIDNTSASQANPVDATWYNLGTTLSIPIGIWNVEYFAAVDIAKASSTGLYPKMTLSTANNTQISADYTACGYSQASIKYRAWFYKTKVLNIVSKTTYYLNVQSGGNSADSITTVGTISPTTICAISAYL